jgi:hypothetical protein
MYDTTCGGAARRGHGQYLRVVDTATTRASARVSGSGVGPASGGAAFHSDRYGGELRFLSFFHLPLPFSLRHLVDMAQPVLFPSAGTA